MKFHLENFKISTSSYDLHGQHFRSPTRLHYSPQGILWNQSNAKYALREFGESYWKTGWWNKCCHLQIILCQQECGCDNDRGIGTSRLLHCHLLHRNTLHTLRNVTVPGMMETVLRARSTRKVRRPARLPTSMPMVAYPEVMTTKSSQFQGFLRYVYLLRMKPLAIDLIIISAV